MSVESAAALILEDNLPAKFLAARVMAISDASFDNRNWASMAKTERMRYVSRSLSALESLDKIGVTFTSSNPFSK